MSSTDMTVTASSIALGISTMDTSPVLDGDDNTCFVTGVGQSNSYISIQLSETTDISNISILTNISNLNLLQI